MFPNTKKNLCLYGQTLSYYTRKEIPSGKSGLKWLVDAVIERQNQKTVFDIVRKLGTTIGTDWVLPYLTKADPKTNLDELAKYLASINDSTSDALLSWMASIKFYNLQALVELRNSKSVPRMQALQNILLSSENSKEVNLVKKEAMHQICESQSVELGKYLLPYVGIKDFEDDLTCLKNMEIDHKGNVLLKAFDTRIDDQESVLSIMNLIGDLKDSSEKQIVTRSLKDSRKSVREKAMSIISDNAMVFDWCFDILRKNLFSEDDRLKEISINGIRKIYVRAGYDKRAVDLFHRLNDDEKKLAGVLGRGIKTHAVKE